MLKYKMWFVLSLLFLSLSFPTIHSSVTYPNNNPDQHLSEATNRDSIQNYSVSAKSHSFAMKLIHQVKNTNNIQKLGFWVLLYLTGALVGIVFGVLSIFIIFKSGLILKEGRSKRSNETSLHIFSTMIKKPDDLAFLDEEDGLASFEIIGRGGCGQVYKCVLPSSDGKEIAIKEIIVQSEGHKMRQIMAEIQTVGQIRHRNLVPLLAHLPRPDRHYLVYEYMKNGSLQDCLKHVAEGRRELDWPARYKIALGVAFGLEYLHTGHSPRIVHRDLKPANVLLDDEMEARITDFGLAEMVNDADTHFSASNVVGTIGYIALEYYETLTFTDKCDVYSFGVLLGALIMGKFPCDDFFQHTDEMTLVGWMRKMMASDDPERAIEPKLLGNGYEEQMLLALKIACLCTLRDPKDRPNSKDVRCMLSQIKN